MLGDMEEVRAENGKEIWYFIVYMHKILKNEKI